MRDGWESAPHRRWGATPEEVANAIKFLVSEESSFCTGQSINITGGFIMT